MEDEPILGEGCSSVVKVCQKLNKTSRFAVKIHRNAEEEHKKQGIKEFELLKDVNHESVLKLYEIFYNERTLTLYFVMELVSGV